jgi:hypothetical protein
LQQGGTRLHRERDAPFEQVVEHTRPGRDEDSPSPRSSGDAANRAAPLNSKTRSDGSVG